MQKGLDSHVSLTKMNKKRMENLFNPIFVFLAILNKSFYCCDQPLVMVSIGEFLFVM